MVGKIVAERYRIERLIGQGGMGSVWLARHLSLGKPVAVKLIHPALASSPQALHRFEVEARAAARVRSRHAVEVHDHGVDGGLPFIVMEYLQGESLEQRLRRAGPLPLSEVTELVRQVAIALDLAHQAGVVHRDLKPDNIFLALEREAACGYTVKVVDFGIAKLLSGNARAEGQTQAGTVLGTPHYMSPEALTGCDPVGPLSDLWSLGACAFAAACNRVPFPGEVIGEVVLKVCAEPLPVPSQRLPSLPKQFDRWFAKACARRPAERFQSARELAEALAELPTWRGESTVSALGLAPEPSSLAEGRMGSRGRALVLAGAAATIAALGYLVLQQKMEAQAAIDQTAARAAALIDAENERKLAEAERHFWAERADAGAADAGTAAAQRRKPRSSE